MEFDLKDGLFLREVRQLGFRKLIPIKMIENVELGKRFYREALTLKQIAHFYNNIFSQIIPSQKPMVLEQAEIRRSDKKNPKTLQIKLIYIVYHFKNRLIPKGKPEFLWIAKIMPPL